MIRVQVGDTVEIRLQNASDSKVTHNIDLHSVNGPGGGAESTNVAPGETKAFSFKALAPGLFTYHCAQGIVADHISNGMYGGILVEEPRGKARYDREYYIGQHEYYLTDTNGPNGVPALDVDKMLAEDATYVVWNGATDGLTGDNALTATTGETEKGRSISVIRKALPRKSNLVIAQAAAIPKTALSGTAMAATISVSRIAAWASVECRLCTETAHPWRSASAKTTIRGAKSRIAIKNTTAPISS